MRLAPTRSSWTILAVFMVFVPRLAASGNDDPPRMRYRFEAGKTYQYIYAYQLKSCEGSMASSGVKSLLCEADQPEQFRIRAMNGDLILHNSGNKDNLTVLHDRRTRDAADLVIPQFDRPAVPEAAAVSAPNAVRGSRARGMTFSRTGELIEVARLERASAFLMGYNSQFAIETLPGSPAKSWTKTSGRTLRVSTSGATCPAQEETRCTVVAVKGDRVFLTKNYLLRSDPYDNGATRLTMNGCGTLEFDVKLGVFRAAAMNYVISIAHGGKLEAVPISLTYSLVDAGQVVAAPKSPAATAAARSGPPPAKPREPLTAAARQEIVRDLKSTTGQTVRNASLRLIDAKVDDDPREMSAALAQAMKGLSDWDRAAVLDALAIWGTENCEAALIEASTSNTFFVRGKALEQLGNKFKDQAAIAAVAKAFSADRHAASAAMKKIGPAGEKAMLPFVKDNKDFWARNDAIGVLAEIGGVRSLRMLKHELKSSFSKGNPLETGPFNSAIDKITKRLESDPNYSSVDDPAKPKSRMWSDLTGTFEVEATIKAVKDYKVTLKKADGKEITVPLETLSEDDQDYVKEYLKVNAAAKPKNPFEQ